MSENFDMPFCYAFLCEIRRKSDHVLRAEPVGIEIGKTERFIQCDRRRVSLDNLKICFRCTEPDSLGEDCAADRGSVVAVAVRRMHMDGIDTDVIAVADAKAGGNDRSGFILDGGTDGFFWNSAVHRIPTVGTDEIPTYYNIMCRANRKDVICGTGFVYY